MMRRGEIHGEIDRIVSLSRGSESFDKHYEQVHTPLVEKMPGLKKLEVTRIQGAPMGGEAPYYLEAAMYLRTVTHWMPL